jgi:hypothetical protein
VACSVGCAPLSVRTSVASKRLRAAPELVRYLSWFSPPFAHGRVGWVAKSRWLIPLPAVLDTFVVLEEELEKEKLEEAERKRAERKERERVRAKERRKRKKLGEWWRIPEANWIHTPHS